MHTHSSKVHVHVQCGWTGIQNSMEPYKGLLTYSCIHTLTINTKLDCILIPPSALYAWKHSFMSNVTYIHTTLLRIKCARWCNRLWIITLHMYVYGRMSNWSVCLSLTVASKALKFSLKVRFMTNSLHCMCQFRCGSLLRLYKLQNLSMEAPPTTVLYTETL